MTFTRTFKIHCNTETKLSWIYHNYYQKRDCTNESLIRDGQTLPKMKLEEFLKTSTNFKQISKEIQGQEVFQGKGLFCLRGNMETPRPLKFLKNDTLQDEFEVKIMGTRSQSLIFRIDQHNYSIVIENQFFRASIDDKPPTICLEFPNFNLLIYPNNSFDSKELGEAYLKRSIQSMKDYPNLNEFEAQTFNIDPSDYESEWIDLIQKASTLPARDRGAIKNYTDQLEKVLSLEPKYTNDDQDMSIKSEIALILRETPVDLQKLKLLESKVASYEYHSLLESTFQL